jgi:hypothetical protein
MKIIYPFILSIVTLLSCQETVEPNITSTVYGIVLDSTTQQPIPNFKLKVGEYNMERVGLMLRPQFIQYLDSTLTYSNGYYSMTFNTSGQGDYYQLEYELPDGYTFYDPNYASEYYKEITLRENNEINLFLQKTATLKARIIVHENPSPPLKLYHPLNRDKVEEIHGFNNDTIIYMQVGRNSRNRFWFTIVKEHVESHSELLDVGDVALNDTIKHTFEVYPSDFD